MTDILASLRQIFAEILLCEPNSIPIERPYVDLGIDSILAIQVAKSIKIILDHDITTADIYNAVTIKNLAEFIRNRKSVTPLTHDVTSTTLPSDRIAITGISGQFPGAADADALWGLLGARGCSILPSSRWSATFKGGFLEHIDAFDCSFFNLSPKAVTFMDPQQRLLLENAYLAFHDAGLSPEDLYGMRGGVFVTSLPGDYRHLINREAQGADDALGFTGNTVSLYAARISHFFNLKGPSLYLDTACSSSLVCLDQAVRHLRDRTCDVALVGASSIFVTDELFGLVKAARLLSQRGECRPFDARADGLIPSEMVVCIVLQRAEEVILPPYGTIRAIGVNHDGLTNGLISPNGKAQEELIQSTYARYNVDRSQIGYIETHGTGTPIGDPIELQALQNSFAGHDCSHIAIGSIKANIGHGLVASGLAGLCKILKIFENQTIPPQIHYTKPNPDIANHPFLVNTEDIAWPQERSLAAMSAFGFGGTNAHMVVEKPLEVRRTNPRHGIGLQKKSYWVQSSLPGKHDIGEGNLIRDKLASILGYQNSKEVPLDRSLTNLGVDSISILSILELLSPSSRAANSQELLNKTVAELIQEESPATTRELHNREKLKLEWVCSGPQDGKPIILLSPLNTISDIWIQQRRYFQLRGWRLLTPHYPGHGSSPYTPCSLKVLANMIERDLRDGFAIKKAAPIVGWSLGGCIGLLLTTQAPDCVSSLILTGTAAQFDHDLFAKSTKLKQELLSYNSYLSYLFQSTDPLKIIGANCSMEILAHYYGELESFSHKQHLRSISKKCLIIHGAKDSVVGDRQIQDLRTIPQSQTITIDDGSHFIPLTAPWVFNQALVKFLENAA